MRDLARHLESIGAKNIRTYIQSGNAVFESSAKNLSKLGEQISDVIKDKHGFKPHVLILSVSEFERAMHANPFPEAKADPKSLHLFFLTSKPLNPDMAAMEGLKAASERFSLIDRVFYLHAPDGIGRSKLAAHAEKLLGVSATARNWRTIRKISELVGGD